MKKKNTQEKPADRKHERKKSLLRSLVHTLIFLLIVTVGVAGGVFLYARYTKTHYEITFYQETSKKVSHNIRLAVISDLHNREYGEKNQTLIADLKALKPDLILFLGDMINRQDGHYEPMLELGTALSEVAPCYGVLGNHESERMYYYDDMKIPEKFREAGVKILRNTQEMVTVGADTIQLIGLEGTPHGFEEYGGRKFMDGTSIRPDAYCIVMNHIPFTFRDQISDYPFDLGIAGHSHGGLIILPFFGGVYTAEEGFFPKYYKGRNRLKLDQSLIISRGMGDSSPWPRINNMPELVIIDVNCY
ncbi:MAG: metallophosphoesterase [Clostridia bacterium]|nr:metallophosphoesterase [Clostridia bacterium]